MNWTMSKIVITFNREVNNDIRVILIITIFRFTIENGTMSTNTNYFVTQHK